MCKKRIQIDGLDFCLGEESADGMFGTYLTHFSVLFYCVTKTFSSYFKNSYYGYNEGLFLLSSYVVIG